MKKNTYLLLTVFVSGMTTLGVELSASRLLDPFFGNSLIIWANIIGLMLVYLSLGYVIGGRWADRDPRETTLFQIVAWAAFLVGCIPLVSAPILRWSVAGFAAFDAAIIISSLFGVLVLFSLPMTMLGMVSPFAIRLAVTEIKDAGRIAGSIYAFSTLGSILGTFLPVLVLIPNIGTRNTFSLFAVTLLLIALGGMLRNSRWLALGYSSMLWLILAWSLWGYNTVIKAEPYLDVVYETESRYNYIQVIQRESETWLRLNDGTGIHSVYSPREVAVDGIWDYFLLVPFFNPAPYTTDQVDNLLIIGAAAGTVSKQYTAIYGPIPIDGVEIDPAISAVGERFFAMHEPNLTTINQDGRYYLANVAKTYDVIIVDAYRPPYIPFQLTTQEFFQEIYTHLSDEGVVAINAGRSETDYSLVVALGSTMKAVFPSVYVIDEPTYGSSLGNSLVVATKQPTQFFDFITNTLLLPDSHLQIVSGRALNNRVWQITCTSDQSPFQVGAGPLPQSLPPHCSPPFTDDKAPIEQVIHGLIVRYMLGG